MLPELHKPSIQRIIWTDYTAFIFSMLPVAIWVIVLAWVPDWRGTGSIVPADMAPFWIRLAAAASIVALLVIGWRVSWFRSMFETGKVVPGKIGSVNFRRDRGRVEYVYAFQNKPYQAHAILHRTHQTRRLQRGDRVVLIVDPSHPERAFIRDLFT